VLEADRRHPAVVAGRLGHDEAHSASLWSHADVLRLKSVVELIADPDFEVSQPRGCVVTISLANGTVVEQRVEHPKGHRFREPPPGWDDLRDKWAELLAVRIGAVRADEFHAACLSMETVDDVRDLVGLLTSPA
jgi:2-methylcitrate dehydratase PrpD